VSLLEREARPVELAPRSPEDDDEVTARMPIALTAFEVRTLRFTRA
jgi:hypothetical protein